MLLILGVVPLATLGGLIALHLTGMTLNVASGVGFIALFGVAVMNGVIMVANLNRVREQGVPLLEAVLAGAGERLRPVLMTATVATVGMLPAALATGVGSDVQRSLATVVAGGLIPATLLTLFIDPDVLFRDRALGGAARAGGGACGREGFERCLRQVSRTGEAPSIARSLLMAATLLLAGCAVGPDFVHAAAAGRERTIRRSLARAPRAPDCGRPDGGRRERSASSAISICPGNGGRCSIPRRSTAWSRRRSRPIRISQAAQAALRVAKENVYAQQGALLPTVDANVGAIRQQPAIGAPSDAAPSRRRSICSPGS